MHKLSGLIVAVTILASAAAQAGTMNATPVTFPAYADEKGLNLYASQADYEHAVADKRFTMEKFAYQSDGLTVYAYIYRPVATPSKPLPVIVFNRGSYTWPAFHAEMLPMAERMANAGFLVIAPMYRGSGGAMGKDEIGGAELDDLFNIVPVIKSISYADVTRMYLYGESRGGMMVYQAMRDGFPAKAAAVYGGFTDLNPMLDSPMGTKMGAMIWGDQLATERDRIVTRRSAIQWADRINMPVLIMQGGNDKSVDPAQSLKLAEELHRLGKPFELVIMDGENHVLTGRAAERDRLVDAWFDKHNGP